jgi:DNA-binding response OmpR family regulator
LLSIVLKAFQDNAMHNPVKHLPEFGPFRRDPEHRLLWRNQQPVPLSPKAFDLLLVLTQRGGEVVPEDGLMKMLRPDTIGEGLQPGQRIYPKFEAARKYSLMCSDLSARVDDD